MTPEEIVNELEANKNRYKELLVIRTNMVLAAYKRGIKVSAISRKLNMQHSNVSAIIRANQ